MLPYALPDVEFLAEDVFNHRLHLERRRTARSRRPFIFMLLEAAGLLAFDRTSGVSRQIVTVLANSIRETDICGWYESGSAIGFIFTEIGVMDGASAGNMIAAKLRDLLSRELTADQVSQISLSFSIFPEDRNQETDSLTAALYPEPVRSPDSGSSVAVAAGGSR